MKRFSILATCSLIISVVLSSCGGNSLPIVKDGETGYMVTFGECGHGSISVKPALPEEGAILPEGTVLKVKAKADPGYVFESGYRAKISRIGNFVSSAYTEYPTKEFTITVDAEMAIGASFVEESRVKGIDVINNIVFAKPGVKTLKYDVYKPSGAKNLPGIVVVHGGGWTSNDEDVMRGYARRLTDGGKYVTFSIDYRWLGTGDGDETPNTMNNLIEDVFGAILHIQEHAAEYGLDPNRLGVTGVSAGGHLSACAATLIERVGNAGFGKTPGVYQFIPTYLPAGMDADKARECLKAIKAAAPSCGVFAQDGLGKYVEDLSPEAQEAVFPICNIPDVNERTIPHFINRGTEDKLISDQSNQEYQDALVAKGQESQYYLVEGANHAFFAWKPDQKTKDIFDKFGLPCAEDMLVFFDKYLQK
ncbi:MAG: alpha/beta hydrolase [Bacteroidales bacterium]|nr:alpha/beta hydrolase [Bacteroidales bacterium]